MNVGRLRRDFPLLRARAPPAYLDNACTTLKPQRVLDAVQEYLSEFPVCAGRSVHRRAAEVTRRVAQTRADLAAFLKAPRSEHVVFTKNTTEAINLVAHATPWRKGDVVAVTDKEHNSNWLPWLHVSRTRGVRLRILPTHEDGTLDLGACERLLRRAGDRLRLVSLVHVSNADGVTNDVAAVARLAHETGARVLADAAQSLPHRPVSVRSLGADFVAGSGHKMLGPPGVGFLWATPEAWQELGPFQLGGNTVKHAGVDDYEWHDLPHRYEAGLQNYAGILGLAPAIAYLERVGRPEIHAHERALNERATRALERIPGVTVHGPSADRRGGIVPFNVEGFNPHEVALYLDEAADVAVRSGAHCVNSYFARRGLEGWVRASVYLYNHPEDIDRFTEAVADLAKSRPQTDRPPGLRRVPQR